MPVTATLLGSASGSGVDLTIPITLAQPAGTYCQVFCTAFTGPEGLFESQGFRSLPDDTEGGLWNFTSPRPFIGNTGDGAGGSGSRVFANIVSCTRTGGTDLVPGSGTAPRTGCTTCGSMLLGTPTGTLGGGGSGGDSVTVHFFNTNAVAPNPTFGFVVAFDGLLQHFETSDQSQYGNGLQYPSDGSSSSTLLWATDPGPGFLPTPAADCAMITHVAAAGADGFVPANGTLVAEIESAGDYMAFSFDGSVAGGSTVEPGGTFAKSGSILIGNYQFVQFA
jgi:hypothetical protein